MHGNFCLLTKNQNCGQSKLNCVQTHVCADAEFRNSACVEYVFSLWTLCMEGEG